MTASEPLPLWKRQYDRCDVALANEEQELTDWEEKFLKSLLRQLNFNTKELSPKQLACLETIEDIIQNGRKTR